MHSSASSPPPASGSVSESLIALAALALGERVLLTRLTVAGVALALGVAFAMPTTYTASATLQPQGRGGGNPMSGLAAQFGVSLPGGDAAAAVQLYPVLLQSRDFLRAVASSRFPAAPGDSQPLYVRYGVKNATGAAGGLYDSLRVNVVPGANLIRISVKSRNDTLAVLLSNRIVDLFNQFNLDRRQTQLSAERRFVEGRATEVKRDLTDAENRLRDFLKANRDIGQSPQLRFEQGRLEREVSVRQTIYTQLAQSLETARIEEVRDVPVLSGLDRAELPLGPDSRRLPVVSALGAMMGLLLGFVWAWIRTALLGRPAASSDLGALRRATAADLRRPWKLLLP